MAHQKPSKTEQHGNKKYDPIGFMWFNKRIYDFKKNLDLIISSFNLFDCNRVMMNNVNYRDLVPSGVEITKEITENILMETGRKLLFCLSTLANVITYCIINSDDKNRMSVGNALAVWASYTLKELVIGKIFPLKNPNKYLWNGINIITFTQYCQNSIHPITGSTIPLFIYDMQSRAILPGNLVDATYARLIFMNKNLPNTKSFMNKLWFASLPGNISHDIIIKMKNTTEEIRVIYTNIFKILMNDYLVLFNDFISFFEDNRILEHICHNININLNSLQSNNAIGWSPINVIYNFMEFVRTKDIDVCMNEIFHFLKNDKLIYPLLENPCKYKFNVSTGSFSPVYSKIFKHVPK